MRDAPLKPLKKNWKKGHLQIGLFLRTEIGTKLEMVVDDASAEQKKLVMKFLRAK